MHEFHSYVEINKWKDEQLGQHQFDSVSLNQFHDVVMQKVFRLSIFLLNRGEPPCSYAWFITGSGGRKEQGVVSDQDHGIIYKDFSKEANEYFVSLGKELSYGMNMVGYPYCEGNVMSSNPIWCNSIEKWEFQLLHWLENESFESIRFLQIFYDSRILVGEDIFITRLKSYIDHYLMGHPKLLVRFKDTVMFMKNSIGPLGQFIIEDKGSHEGSIDLKNSAFIPYVNAIRLLAIKEGIHETSTIERIECLAQHKYKNELLDMKTNFEKLLIYRLKQVKDTHSYKDSHYLNIKKLNKDEKKEIKQILKDGKKLYQYVNTVIEKGVSHGL